MAEVSVIVRAFGPQHYLDACLSALAKDGEDHEVIVVDNATGWPIPDWCVVIRNAENKGCTAASNQGAEIATGDYFIFLDVDTEVQPGWMTPLVTAMQQPNIAMAGPKHLYPPQKGSGIQCAGIVVHKLGGHNRLTDEGSGLAPGVTGATMAIRRDVFNEVGGLDEGLKNGFDDVDLCLTVSHAGWGIWYESDSIVWHWESVTSPPDRWMYSQHNVDYLRAKWAPIDFNNEGYLHPHRTHN